MFLCVLDKSYGFEIKVLTKMVSKHLITQLSNISSAAMELYVNLKVRDKELTGVTHPAMERIGRASWLGEVMAHKSNGGRKSIATRTWP